MKVSRKFSGADGDGEAAGEEWVRERALSRAERERGSAYD